MRFQRVSRRWLVAGGIVLGGLLLVLIGLGVIYPRVGAYMIRKKVSGRLAAKLGRDIKLGDIDVSLGHAVLRDVDIVGPRDGAGTPLVHIDRVDVDFDAWSSLTGTIKLGDAKVANVMISLRRDTEGRDNVRDVIDSLRAEKAGKGDGAKSSSLGSMRPKKITVTGIRMLADDAITGTTALVDG